MGSEFLEFSLKKIEAQSFTDYNVIVSDNSKDTSIQNLCSKWEKKIDLRYSAFTASYGSIGPNLNNVLELSNGKFTKILLQDDFFYSPQSLELLAPHLTSDKSWIINACTHTENGGKSFIRPYSPKYDHQGMKAGKNTLSCPSSLTLNNKHGPYLFNPTLKFYLDCEFYCRMFHAFGAPAIIPDILTVNRIHSASQTKELLTSPTPEWHYLYEWQTLQHLTRDL